MRRFAFSVTLTLSFLFKACAPAETAKEVSMGESVNANQESPIQQFMKNPALKTKPATPQREIQQESQVQQQKVEAIWVVRSDGSKSCEPQSGTPLEQGAAELTKAKVTVMEKKKADDGMAHIMVCGAKTGSQNSYKIPRNQLGLAQKLGFKRAP